jgi:hypothetical protein
MTGGISLTLHPADDRLKSAEKLQCFTAPWCSGLTCHPVTVEIGGSNPPGVASNRHFCSRRLFERIFDSHVLPVNLYSLDEMC